MEKIEISLDEPLHHCDLCGCSEIEDIIDDEIVGGELRQMYIADDGITICENCKKNET